MVASNKWGWLAAFALAGAACQSSGLAPAADARPEAGADLVEPDAPGDALLADLADALEADRAPGDVALADAPPDAAACGFGEARCGGACVRVDDNDLACGACGRACGPAQQCRNGACDIACAAGESQCPNCNDLGSDPTNCGA